MPAHRRWKHTRQQGADDAVNPRHAGAHGDEREHVEIAGLERGPGALEERPPGPQHDGRRQQELNPVRCLLAEPLMEVRSGARPFPGRTPAPPAPSRSRTAATYRQARDWGPCRPTPAPARAPCRRSGTSRDPAAGSRDASGRCRSCPPAQARRAEARASRYCAGLATNFSRQPAEQK